MANEIIPSLNIRDDFTRDTSGKLVVDSRYVAARFGKEHRNVLQSIDNTLQEAPEALLNFQQSSYVADNKQTYRCFLMDRDGFSLLAMGFTGAEALQWKLKYISAFNALEAEVGRLSAPKTRLELARENVALIEELEAAEAREAAQRIRADDAEYRAIVLADQAKIVAEEVEELTGIIQRSEPEMTDYTVRQASRRLSVREEWLYKTLQAIGAIVREVDKARPYWVPSAEWRANDWAHFLKIPVSHEDYYLYPTKKSRETRTLVITRKGMRRLERICQRDNWPSQCKRESLEK